MKKAITRRIKANKITGCWEWIGSKSAGYGVVYISGKRMLLHRIFYEIYKRKIPNKMVVDHLCFHRNCVNPKHLEVVTISENVKRYWLNKIKNSRKLHGLGTG